MKTVRKISSFILDNILKEGKIMQKAGQSKYGFCW